MIELMNNLIYVVTALAIIVVVFYAVSSKTQFTATLVQKQVLEDGTQILTFIAPQNKSKLGLKIGQQLLIKTKPDQKGRQFTPIQSSVGSFKILLIPSMQITLDSNSNSKSDQDKIYKQLQSISKDGKIYVRIAKNNLQYVGNSQIRVTAADNKVHAKKYKNVYILAQGNKVPIAYQIAKGICEDKSQQKPNITVLFVGGQISDFALKNQFQHLQDNYDNIKYFYSIPVKGERQPSVAGMGISSQKVSQSFGSNIEDTFCILCAEQADLSVTVERALLNKKISSEQIYKY